MSYLEGVALGAFLATLAFLFAFMLIDFKLSNDDWVGFFGNIVVALFSIGAAWLALQGNKAQLQQAADLEEERRRRSLAAARAMLPAVLSEICQVAQNNLRLRFVPGHGPIGSELPAATVFQSMPESVIPVLKEVIQYADPASQDRLSNILRHFQVFEARRTGTETAVLQPLVTEGQLLTHNAISEVLGWAAVYAMAASAFEFARGTSSSIPPAITAADVRRALFSASIVLENYPLLVQILDARAQGGRLELRWDV
ncbi:hypothetical protein GCM10010924_50620 [Rhizobium wenxiniae]|uniref:Uncharacterized protein n=1 Tax=Rhizobium wenxiniae TaxID=1737357 RepID=A0A7W9YBK6_9HYPH|nr:hypothetical protein [Rhizobium wenxiniae]MBB6165427.1 hypothetical protein [Rhizobium wenxiniae]GGG15434.1 hypothetical protein GCM10010924_50620 [Rhizobium wenxiniae]